MSGVELFHGFFKKGDFSNLALLSLLTWLFTTIAFKLFGIENSILKLLIPLSIALLTALVREPRLKTDEHKHYYFRVFANGAILFVGAVMISKTFYTLGKLPQIEFAMMPNLPHQESPQHQYEVSAESPTANTKDSNAFEFWYAKKTDKPTRQNAIIEQKK